MHSSFSIQGLPEQRAHYLTETRDGRSSGPTASQRQSPRGADVLSVSLKLSSAPCIIQILRVPFAIGLSLGNFPCNARQSWLLIHI